MQEPILQPQIQPVTRRVLETLVEPDMEVSYWLDDAPDYGCESEVPRCSNEAVRRLFWKPAVEVEDVAPDSACRCYRSSLACLRCFETFNDNHGGIIACAKCGNYMQIARAEALR